jgi:citrate synthase
MLVRTLRAARPTQLLRCASAVPQTSPDATLKETLTAQIPQKQAELKALKAEHGSKVLGEVTVDQCIGGGRGVRCMLWETSLLDAAEGIRFRGYTIPECQELLPTFKGPAGDGEPTPEAILWLLLTGEIPTKEQCDGLTAELFERSALPAHATQLLDALPKTMHPMTQFSLGLQAYFRGVPYGLDPSRLRALSRRRRQGDSHIRYRCEP